MPPVLPSSPDRSVLLPHSLARRNASFDGHWRDGTSAEGFIIEAWSEGFMVGALLIMACITVAAMRKGILLHKLILCEVRRPFRGHSPPCSLEGKRLTEPRHPATSRHVTWHVLFHGLQRLRLVSVVDSSVALLFIFLAQCRCVDQSEAFLRRLGAFL